MVDSSSATVEFFKTLGDVGDEKIVFYRHSIHYRIKITLSFDRINVKISRSVRITHAGSCWVVKRGWNYRQGVLSLDLGLFISLAAVL